MAADRPARKVKRPTPGGAPMRRPPRSDGTLVTVTEVSNRFEADAVAALAESQGYQVLVEPIIGYAAWGTDTSFSGGFTLSAHEQDAGAVRALLEQHGVEVVHAAGLPWRGALAVTVVVVFIVVAVVMAASYDPCPGC